MKTPLADQLGILDSFAACCGGRARAVLGIFRSGRQSTAVDDRAKIAELWDESWKIWFPAGKDDPTLTLLRIRGETGEYWDNSGFNGIKYLLEAGKAYLTGTRPDVDGDPKIHGKIVL